MAKEYDPKIHSAEHILNQTMDRQFGCGRCFSSHLEPRKSKCDYHFDRELTPDEANQVEQQVNEIIQADLPVTEEFLTRSEAERRYNLSRLPAEAGDNIRIIRIGDYDACPCIGQHVRSTREIGVFRITSMSFENGVLRLRFKLQDATA